MERIHKLFHGVWKDRYRFHSVAAILLMAIIIAVVYLAGDNEKTIFMIQEEEDYEAKMVASCDFFNGSWVFDNNSRPLYREQDCPFMTDDYACQKYGRKDSKYQFWRWQPHGCDLPRFNGTRLLEKLRGKSVIFVGDSLGKNHWVSLLCLINTWIPDPSQKVAEWHGSLITFKAFEYNVSIDFYWEPLLVESNCDDPVHHRVQNRIIKVESIESHAKNWVDADMLVFDSYTWWLNPNMTLLWGSFEHPDNRTYVEFGKVKRYEWALKTWTNWLETHLNRTKTKLFFTSQSPYHMVGEDWGKGFGETCFNETEPIKTEGFQGRGSDTELMTTAESAVQELKTKGFKIKFLNITQLSDYRKDGHPAIYKKQWVPPTESELANPGRYADCIHWCLPGIPDVWNEILSLYVVHDS